MLFPILTCSCTRHYYIRVSFLLKYGTSERNYFRGQLQEEINQIWAIPLPVINSPTKTYSPIERIYFLWMSTSWRMGQQLTLHRRKWTSWKGWIRDVFWWCRVAYSPNNNHRWMSTSTASWCHDHQWYSFLQYNPIQTHTHIDEPELVIAISWSYSNISTSKDEIEPY